MSVCSLGYGAIINSGTCLLDKSLFWHHFNAWWKDYGSTKKPFIFLQMYVWRKAMKYSVILTDWLKRIWCMNWNKDNFVNFFVNIQKSLWFGILVRRILLVSNTGSTHWWGCFVDFVPWKLVSSGINTVYHLLKFTLLRYSSLEFYRRETNEGYNEYRHTEDLWK